MTTAPTGSTDTAQAAGAVRAAVAPVPNWLCSGRVVSGRPGGRSPSRRVRRSKLPAYTSTKQGLVSKTERMAITTEAVLKELQELSLEQAVERKDRARERDQLLTALKGAPWRRGRSKERSRSRQHSKVRTPPRSFFRRRDSHQPSAGACGNRPQEDGACTELSKH